MKTLLFYFFSIMLLFLAVVVVIVFVQQTKKSTTIVFCIEKTESIKDRKYFGVKYYLYSKEGGYIRLFTSTESSAIVEGFIQSNKPVHGYSEFGPQRIYNPEKFSSTNSIDLKEWLLLETGKEYVLQKNVSLPVWKIENDDKTISTVFLSF